MPISSESLSYTFILIASRILIPILLIAASIGKLVNLKEFRQIVFKYNLLPTSIVPLFSYTLPVLEFVSGGALLLGIFSPLAEFTAAGLFLVFALAITINLLRNRADIPCGCSGQEAKLISWGMVTRNLVLFSLALLGLYEWIWFSLSLLLLYVITITVHFVVRARLKTT